MAKKQIMLIYQDCPMCGARRGWGETQTKIANTYGFEIVNTPFYKTGVKGLIMNALEHGIGRMPFFTDGKKFSYSLEDFVEKPKTKRKRNTRQKREEIVNNGDDSTN